MERLNLHLALSLASQYEVAVSGPAGCSRYLAGCKGSIAETRHQPLSRFLVGSALRALCIARRDRPALVIAGSGLTAPVVWGIAQLVGARSAVYLHGLDLVVRNSIYRSAWLPFIRRMQVVLVNSRHTARLAEREGIPSKRIHVLNPGTELPQLKPDVAWEFRQQHGLGDNPLLLSVGRLTARKGIAEFIQRSLPALLDLVPRALFLVIGDDAHDALKNGPGSELNRIRQLAIDSGVSESVLFLPPCDDATLSAAYSAADVHVFPIVEVQGDVEGFGMVAIEAAAHGLPTVAFAVGGVSDAVLHGSTGELIAPGDYVAFTAAVARRLAQRHEPAERLACMQAAGTFAWEKFSERLLALLHEPEVAARQ
ncbi:MAG TPA: glycosyltransferase family 4 protein [Gammaproteobacteria bacterium]